MTRESTKDRELRHLRLFQRLCDAAPQSIPEPGEKPDFALATPSGLIGVEVTQYFRPHVPNPNLRYSRPLQEQDALKDRLVARARELCTANYGIRARVQLLFRPLDVVDGRQVEALAGAISDLIGGLPLSTETQLFAPTRELRFPSPLTKVFAGIVPPDREPVWAVVAAGSVATLSSEHVLAIIRKKESRLVRYRRDLAQIWLLIVQDYRSRASYAELSEEARGAVYESGFHRIFLLRVFENECVNLAVHYKPTPAAT